MLLLVSEKNSAGYRRLLIKIPGALQNKSFGAFLVKLLEVDDCVFLYADSSFTFLSLTAETAVLTNADKNFFVMVCIFLIIKVRQTNITW